MHTGTTLPPLKFDLIRESITSGMRFGWMDYCRLFNDPPFTHRKAIEYVFTVSVAKELLRTKRMDHADQGAIVVEMARNTFQTWAFPRFFGAAKIKRKPVKRYGKQRFDICLLGQKHNYERPSRVAIEIKGVISGWRSIKGDVGRLKSAYAATNKTGSNRISAVYSVSLIRLDKLSEVWDGDRSKHVIASLTATFRNECGKLFRNCDGRPVAEVHLIDEDTAEEAAHWDPYLIEDGRDLAAATGALAVAIVGYERAS